MGGGDIRRHVILRGAFPRTTNAKAVAVEKRMLAALEDIHTRLNGVAADEFRKALMDDDIIERFLNGESDFWDARERTVEARARNFSEAREKAIIAALSHLKNEDAAAIRRAIGKGDLYGVVDKDGMYDRVARIHAEAPWMAPATTAVMRAMRAYFGEPGWSDGRRELRLPPMILLGKPGVGKSAWARSLGRAFGVPSIEVDVGAAKGGAFSLVGPERGWGGSSPGRLVSHMLGNGVANPVVVVDEIDNAPGRISTSRGGFVPGIHETLKSLMEPVSARSWTCPYYQVQLDMSRVNWIMTANAISDEMSASFLDRVQIVHIPDPTPPQIISAGLAMLNGRVRDLDDLAAAKNVLEARIGEEVARGRRVSLRDVRRMAEGLVSAISAPMMN